MSDFLKVKNEIIPQAYEMLDPRMRSTEATGMLLTIGLQESALIYRRQIGGPAMGLWQFESGGGWKGVLNHAATANEAANLLKFFGYAGDPGYEVLAENDVLACCFARLLLWTHPLTLPERGQFDYAWKYYLNLWRPGKPHPETWDGYYRQAWEDL